jgi:hypothetical protein
MFDGHLLRVDGHLLLQDCVTWPVDGQVVITTTEFKDSREHNFNEVRSIASVECVTIFAQDFGKITLQEPLAHRHYAGVREYQAEVGLLTRSIRIQGDASSEPADVPSVGERCTHIGRVGETNGDGTIKKELFTIIPCTENHYLTGYGGLLPSLCVFLWAVVCGSVCVCCCQYVCVSVLSASSRALILPTSTTPPPALGHTLIKTNATARISSIEFFRMGQTNTLGRYPLHFHLLGEGGGSSYVLDCAVRGKERGSSRCLLACLQHVCNSSPASRLPHSQHFSTCVIACSPCLRYPLYVCVWVGRQVLTDSGVLGNERKAGVEKLLPRFRLARHAPQHAIAKCCVRHHWARLLSRKRVRGSQRHHIQPLCARAPHRHRVLPRAGQQQHRLDSKP